VRRPRRSLTLVTGPVREPVTLSDAKAWARLDGTTDDNSITQLIKAVRATAEEYLRRALLTQTYRLTIDLPCGGIDHLLGEGTYDLPVSALNGDLSRAVELPKGPVQSIISVKTTDTADAQTTFAPSNYYLDAAGERLVLTTGATWPSNLRGIAAVEVNYIVGYGDTGDSVPQPIKTGMLIHLASLYEQRGQCDDAMSLPPGTKRLYDQYRVMGERRG
jgi:uncharacterized phiE125 gp8 family phage protein